MSWFNLLEEGGLLPMSVRVKSYQFAPSCMLQWRHQSTDWDRLRCVLLNDGIRGPSEPCRQLISCMSDIMGHWYTECLRRVRICR